MSDDDYRTARADLKSTRKADKAQAKRVKDRDQIAAKSAKKKAKDIGNEQIKAALEKKDKDAIADIEKVANGEQKTQPTA